jgi:uncharacterized membrane protein
MSLSPLLHASPAIQVHGFAAMGAFALGVVQVAAPKEFRRSVPSIGSELMLMVSVSGFYELRI